MGKLKEAKKVDDFANEVKIADLLVQAFSDITEAADQKPSHPHTAEDEPETEIVIIPEFNVL